MLFFYTRVILRTEIESAPEKKTAFDVRMGFKDIFQWIFTEILNQLAVNRQ